jgi:hypothetical protein
MVKVRIIPPKSPFSFTTPSELFDTIYDETETFFSPDNPSEVLPTPPKIDIGNDDCNTVITVTQSHPYINLPQVEIITRNPYCRQPPPPPPASLIPPPTRPSVDSSCAIGNGIGIMNRNYYLSYEDGISGNYNDLPCALWREEQWQKILEWNPGNGSTPLGTFKGREYYFFAKWQCRTYFKHNSQALANKNNSGINQLHSLAEDRKAKGYSVPDDYSTNPHALWILERTDTVNTYYDISFRHTNEYTDSQASEYAISYPGLFISGVRAYQQISEQVYSPKGGKYPSNSLVTIKQLENLTRPRDFGANTLFYKGYFDSIGGRIYLYSAENMDIDFETYEFLCSPFTKNPPPQPPPPPDMSCCPNVKENDALLRLIAKRLGVSDYPVTVPKVITDESKGNISLENLTRFTSYLVKQLDAVSGNYPIQIEIEDADLTQEGNQKRTIKIPNAAEGIAESLGQLLSIRSETNATLKAVCLALIDIASTKQTALITHDYAKANSEFLGYKGKQVIRKIPFASSIGKERLDEFLKESEIEVKGFENDDGEDIKDVLIPLLEMLNIGHKTIAMSELMTRLALLNRF